MREIKFRGKRLDTQEWEYGDFMRDNQGGCYVFPIEAENLYGEYKVDKSTLGQYTGLKDKNDKEIYDGDIVVATNLMVDGFGEQMLTSIVYDEELACFDFKALDRQRCICNSVLDVELEVIGNIFDNPELLENE